MTTTAEFVRRWAHERPDHPALRWGDNQLTYRQLNERSSQAAQALHDAGVGPQQRVAYMDKNGPEQIELFFACAKLNAVATPVNFRLAPPEVAVIVADSESKVFIVGEEYLPLVDKIAADLPGVKIVVIGNGGSRGDYESYEDWRDRYPAEDPLVPQGAEDVTYQLYSSGTTGRPKGVELTNANFSAGLTLYPERMDFDADSVSLVAMPLFHIGGSGWALAGLAVGATNVIVRDLVPAGLVDLIERERITHGFLVPAVLQFMLAVPGVSDHDFSSLKCILYGASPISEEVLSASIKTFRCRFIQVYGLTETTGSVVLLPADDHDPDGPNRHRLRAAGLPVPGTEVRIVESSGDTDVAQGDVGEIWIRGPMVMKGYWHLPEATEEAIRPGGWFRSGDVGYRDADGYVYLYDRMKDMIVSGGENVYPAEVENVLMSHPGVGDVAVIGVPHERWGETPKAMVVRAPATELTGDELIAYCRERLARFKCPTSVEWLDELPRNPSGKILKKDLRAPYWQGRDRLVG